MYSPGWLQVRATSMSGSAAASGLQRGPSGGCGGSGGGGGGGVVGGGCHGAVSVPTPGPTPPDAGGGGGTPPPASGLSQRQGGKNPAPNNRMPMADDGLMGLKTTETPYSCSP